MQVFSSLCKSVQVYASLAICASLLFFTIPTTYSYISKISPCKSFWVQFKYKQVSVCLSKFVQVCASLCKFVQTSFFFTISSSSSYISKKSLCKSFQVQFKSKQVLASLCKFEQIFFFLNNFNHTIIYQLKILYNH